MSRSRREADLLCSPNLSWWIQPCLLCLRLLTFASCRELQKQNKESLQGSLEQTQKWGKQMKQRHSKDLRLHVPHLVVGELTDVFYLSFGNTFATCVLVEVLFVCFQIFTAIPSFPPSYLASKTFIPFPLATCLLLPPARMSGAYIFPVHPYCSSMHHATFTETMSGCSTSEAGNTHFPFSAVLSNSPTWSSIGQDDVGCVSALPFNHPGFLFW